MGKAILCGEDLVYSSKKTKQNKTQLIYPLLTLADASSHNTETFLLASSLISLHFWVNWAGWLKKKKLLRQLLGVSRMSVDRPAGWPASVPSPGCPAGLSGPASCFRGAFESDTDGLCTWALWAGAPSQEALFAEWSCVYLPLGVAAVASGFVAWGGQWGVQPFVITWFLTRLPRLLDGGLAAFPHPPSPGLHKRDMCEAVHTP